MEAPALRRRYFEHEAHGLDRQFSLSLGLNAVGRWGGTKVALWLGRIRSSEYPMPTSTGVIRALHLRPTGSRCAATCFDEWVAVALAFAAAGVAHASTTASTIGSQESRSVLHMLVGPLSAQTLSFSASAVVRWLTLTAPILTVSVLTFRRLTLPARVVATSKPLLRIVTPVSDPDPCGLFSSMVNLPCSSVTANFKGRPSALPTRRNLGQRDLQRGDRRRGNY